MISYIYWNLKKEFLTIPIINFSIMWYSVLFLIGFLVGYYIFKSILKKYYSIEPKFFKEDILSFQTLKNDFLKPKNQEQVKFFEKFNFNKKNISNENILYSLNSYIKNIKNRIFLENIFSKSILSTKKKIAILSDKIVVYMVLSTIIGARLGHLFFYENPSYYLLNPLNIFNLRSGGLASHGAAIGILIGLIFYSKSIQKYKPTISYVQIFDFISPSVAFAGFCIRIGNFINQEIIGVPTTFPTAIVFLNPLANHSIVPRHPVQLYEAFFYLFVFLILYLLIRKKFFLKGEGKIFAIFLILIFSFRFFIEFIKEKQSVIIGQESFLLMGQYLSIPFIVLGVFFLFYKKIKKSFS